MTDLANIMTKFVFRLRVHQRERALPRRRKLIYKGLVLALGTAAMGATIRRCVNSIGGEYPSGLI